VNSLLSQETFFDYEIVIRDDGSTDGTQEIVRDLHRQHPDRIRLILESKNTYPRVKPLDELLASAGGELFAVCDGDDMWTSTHKLQTCVDVLDSYPGVILVGHLVTIRDLESQELVGTSGAAGRFIRGELAHCHTSSFVGRARMISERWSEIGPVVHGDMKLKMIAAEAGESLVIDQLLSEYTVHSRGSWQSRDVQEKAQKKLQTYQVLIPNAKFSRHALKAAAANHGRAYVNRVYQSGHRIEAVFLWLKWIRLASSAKGLVTLFAPPGTARTASVLKRLYRGRLR
jgi:glycosyltransferase involved in cell wall biosynthesis